MKQLLKFLPLVLLLVASSCATRHNNIVSRAYHGTTTHYNYYFNARERMKQGAQTLADAHEDKYDRVLSVFKYGDVAKAKSVYGDMDEAIKKASVAIQRHSIFAKSRKDTKLAERNKWIEDCYLVIGQAQFYKHDFWTAIETFQYTSAEYKTGPIRDDALLWLTKTYLELGKTVDAEYLLDYLKNDKEMPVRLKGDYAATYASYYLQKKQIPEAMEQLAKAAAATKKRDTRARYYFILGQLQQKQDSLKEAFASYSKVIRLNPPYEMAFNARINRARCFDVNSTNGEVVKKELNRMLKDDKNKEYLDQIYYALAGIAQQEKNESLALDYLNQSVRVSTTNTTQKALSYKSMGDVYYGRPDYVPAAAYYDSSITSLTPDHPDYYDILERKNSLARLVKNLKIIAMEDSLQSLSKMSTAEREASIDKVIAQETAEQERIKKETEDKQRIEEQQVLEEKQLKSQPRNFQNPNKTGDWYFYNTTTLAFGVNEFLKKWGLRKLEDDWRRIEKDLIADAGEGEEITSIDSLVDSQAAINDSLSKLGGTERKEAYLKSIPSTEKQIKESNAKLTEAYYNAAIIYKEQLGNLPQSIAHFEKLDERYPQNKYKQPSYYNLYRIYLSQLDTPKADVYKNYLLTNYPESEYSKLILNPNFFAETKKKTAVLQVFYENTYKAYLNGQYADVIERKTLADTLFPKNNILAGKFTLLRALAIGRTQPVPQFEIALEDVVRSYPKDSVSVRAQQILDYIRNRNKKEEVAGDSSAQTKEMNEVINSTAYIFAPESPQMFLIIVKMGMADIPQLKGNIASFNNINYAGVKMDLQSGNLDLNFQYVTVTGLKNKEDAMTYYNTVMGDETVSGAIAEAEPQFFIISQDNLTQLARTHEVEKYASFFQEKYLQ